MNGKNVIILTPHNDPDEPVRPKFSGDMIAAFAVKDALNGATGHYGHLIDMNSTTNLDLQAALYTGREWKVIDITPQIKPNPLPPGVTT